MSDNRLIIGNKTYSSWSFRAWLMAKKTPLEFDELPLLLDTPEFAVRIRDLSPSRRVPALHLGSTVIWDTLAIGEYLAERYPEAQLWPEEPLARARARSVAAEMHAGFDALRRTLPFNCRARDRRVDIDSATAADIARITQLWKDCLTRKTDVGGGLFGHYTIADAMYAPIASRFLTYGIDLDDISALYVSWIAGDEHYKQWVAAAKQESAVIDEEEVGQ